MSTTVVVIRFSQLIKALENNKKHTIIMMTSSLSRPLLEKLEDPQLAKKLSKFDRSRRLITVWDQIRIWILS
jgi:hypothetical protein